jgi:hypothetical protein
MTISKSATRRAAKKPSGRNQLKNGKTRKAMPLRTSDPVRTVLMKSQRDSAEPKMRKRAQSGDGQASTSKNTPIPSSGFITLLMQWSPLGLFLRQQAFLANAMGQFARPNALLSRTS